MKQLFLTTMLAIGVAGAVVTRLRPDGMAWTMGATAAATMMSTQQVDLIVS